MLETSTKVTKNVSGTRYQPQLLKMENSKKMVPSMPSPAVARGGNEALVSAFLVNTGFRFK